MVSTPRRGRLGRISIVPFAESVGRQEAGSLEGAARWRRIHGSRTRAGHPYRDGRLALARQRGIVPRLRIERPVDRGLRGVGETEIVWTRVRAKARQGLGHLDTRAFEHHAFRLLDHDATVECVTELLVDSLRFRHRTLLEHADGGKIREG